MLLINDAFLLILGLIIYTKRPQWVFFYWFSLEPIFLPFSSIITQSFTHEQFYEITNHLKVFGRNYFFILILLEWIKHPHKIPKIPEIYKSTTILMIYLIFTNIISHFSLEILWGYFSEIISLILPLLFLLMKKDAKPSISQIILYFKILLSIEIIAVILNLFHIYVYIPLYFPKILTTFNGEMIEVDNSSLVSGTFSRFNALANCLTTLYLFICLEYYSKINMKSYKFHIITFIFFLIIILTGAKISLVLFAFIYLSCCTYYFKKHIMTFIIAWSITIITSIFLLSFDGTEKSSNAGVNRQIEGLASFAQSEKDEENSTIGLSFYLLNNFFQKSPLIGNHLSYKGELAYGNRGLCTLTHFRADSRLAYQIVEFGIIGFFLYLCFFFSIFLFLLRKVSKQEKIKLIICFLYFFLLTTTESGLFDRINLPLIFLYALCILTPKIKTSIIRQSNNKVETAARLLTDK